MKRLLVIYALFALVLPNTWSMGFAQESASSGSPIYAGTLSLENEGIKASGPTQEQVVEASLDDDDEDFFMLDEDIEAEAIEVADPIYYFNKGMYHFNDKLYFWLLKPAAKGYKWAMPEPARRGVRNFFYNLGFPIRLVGCLLQGKGKAAGGECGRFLMNTTVGVLGFGNPAKKYPSLNPNEEDMGQAFGRWGIGNGFYVVWPVFGPSTARDTVGMVGDFFLHPVSYVEPTAASIGIKSLDTVNSTSFRIGDYEAFKDAAIAPYVAMRNGYIQARKKQVKE